MRKNIGSFAGLALLSIALGSCSSPRPALPTGEAPTAEPGASSNGDAATSMATPLPTPSAAPGLHQRIYQGYSLPKLKSAKFMKIINNKFLPLFPKAHSHGLSAYRPALPKSPKACALPTEIALLTFASEKEYSKYKDSKLGKKIRDAHKLAFRSEKSKSLVAESLTDTIHFDHAYSLNPGVHDYRKPHSAVILHCDPILSGEELRVALVKPYAMGTDAIDILFAVSADHVLEYVFYPKEEDFAARIAERRERFRALFRESTVVKLPKRKLGKKKIKVGEGIDVQWGRR